MTRRRALLGWRGIAWTGMAWTGVALPALAWFLFQQIGGNLDRLQCDGPDWAIPAVGGIALLVTAAMAWLARRAWWSAEGERDRTHSFIARVGFWAAWLFAIAIFWQILSSLLLSGCER